jgi:hypothetical protein
MSAPIKRLRIDMDGCTQQDDDGDYVTHADHLASHAYDEAVELMECAKFIQEMAEKLERHGMMPMSGLEESAIRGAWKKCAKSRAKRFGGAE